MRTIRALALLASVAWITELPAQVADDEMLVVTALPVTYSIASALTRDTSLRVSNVPERGRRLGTLGDLLTRNAERFQSSFAGAAAVVTIGKLWPEDPLYTAARSANIRVVEIDATKPWSTTLEGIAVAAEPRQDAPWAEAPAEAPAAGTPSIYFWLSPTNGARAAEIVARDLERLAPGDAERIEQNLAGFRDELLELKREYETRLAALPDLTVAVLAPELVYLTNEFSLFVDSYFFKQDIDWTDQDLARFEAYLRENDIGVVLHKWEPLEPILAAIEAGGAEVVEIDPIDAGLVEDGRLAADSYTRLLRRNLESLHEALARANAGNP